MAGGHRPARHARSVRRVRVGAASRVLRHVRDRRLRRVHEGAGAARRRDQHYSGAAVQRGASHRALRVPGSDPARQHRNDADGIGKRPDRSLSRPRTAKPCSLRRRELQSRLRALDRGRAEIFRSRRARLGHAALRRLADLRVRRHDRVRRSGAIVRRRRGAVGRADHRCRLRHGRARVQGIGGAVPYVDPRCL